MDAWLHEVATPIVVMLAFIAATMFFRCVFKEIASERKEQKNHASETVFIWRDKSGNPFKVVKLYGYMEENPWEMAYPDTYYAEDLVLQRKIHDAAKSAYTEGGN